MDTRTNTHTVPNIILYMQHVLQPSCILDILGERHTLRGFSLLQELISAMEKKKLQHIVYELRYVHVCAQISSSRVDLVEWNKAFGTSNGWC